MPERTPAQRRGRAGEDVSAAFLQKHGYKVIERNYRTSSGEIDIIASDAEYIVFAEVKTRAHNSISRPAQAVDRKKQKKLIRTAVLYLQENEFELTPRFDVIEVVCDDRTGIVVDINHIENAFMLEAPFASYYY